MREPNDGAQTRPTDTDAQRSNQTSDNVVDCCPECASTNLNRRLRDDLPRFLCQDCRHEFDEPAERPSIQGLRGVALRAARTNVDDVLGDDLDRGEGVETDGGEDVIDDVDQLTEIINDPATDAFFFAVSHPDGVLTYGAHEHDPNAVDVFVPMASSAVARYADYVDISETEFLAKVLEEYERQKTVSQDIDRGDGIETDGGVDPVSVPPEFDEFPHEARRFVLSQANDAADIRVAVNNRVGLSNDDLEADRAGSFTKDELAAVLLALGGPDR